MAKVSICVPTYNNVSEVERLLQSIRRQNYTDYEVNISDDSTNDETEELVERMSGGQVIELKLKAEEEKIKEVFADAEHITAVETKELPEDGVTEVTVTAEKNKDVREEIFHICAESDMPILEMINGGKSLEDIFLELTSKEEE